MLLKAIAKSYCILFTIAIVGRAITLEIKKEAKNWYQKGLRVITLQGAIKKVQCCFHNIGNFVWMDGTIIISYFGGSNNIFADCTIYK